MAFDLSKFAAGVPSMGPRTIETVTEEAKEAVAQIATGFMDLGDRLIEAKEMLPHGEWLPWLEREMHFSERTAQKYMAIAREYKGNPQLASDLGSEKAFALLALPREEREEIAQHGATVDGKTKAASDLTTREVKQIVAERKGLTVLERIGLCLVRQEIALGKHPALRIAGGTELKVIVHKGLVFGERNAEAGVEAEREGQGIFIGIFDRYLCGQRASDDRIGDFQEEMIGVSSFVGLPSVAEGQNDVITCFFCNVENHTTCKAVGSHFVGFAVYLGFALPKSSVDGEENRGASAPEGASGTLQIGDAVILANLNSCPILFEE